jgi:hypothetical protein
LFGSVVDVANTYRSVQAVAVRAEDRAEEIVEEGT